MDDTSSERGPESAQAPREPDVQFGPRDTDKMPLSWASECLTWLYEHNRPVFGRMMLARLDIETRTPGRKPAKP